jgi:hypothetical protein
MPIAGPNCFRDLVFREAPAPCVTRRMCCETDWLRVTFGILCHNLFAGIAYYNGGKIAVTMSQPPFHVGAQDLAKALGIAS